jgi:septal ring factor EnvC (AmiA/AmiB activator)
VVSTGADPRGPWAAIEAAVEEARAALASLRARASEERSEVERLRAELAAIARTGEEDSGETAALQAENALLRSRLEEARRRLDAVIARVEAFDEEEPPQ